MKFNYLFALNIKKMKNTLILLLVVLIYSCGKSPDKESSDKEIDTNNFTKNMTLDELYKSDQADRQTADIDWPIVTERDNLRRKRVYQLLDSNKVVTADDYANAAMVFQHGGDTIASGMAVKLMQKAVDLDSNRSKWLLAAAIDRDLMRRDRPQLYGTQYTKAGTDEPWIIYDIDTTKISDAERREYGVETLAEQRAKVRMMNKKKLSELLESGKSIDEIIELVKNADLANSEYNLSESGINSFGYELAGANKNEDALKVFKLNTELYPDGFNTYDSYGELLMKLGKEKEGIVAYKKSLELNPKNENAIKVLKELDETSNGS